MSWWLKLLMVYAVGIPVWHLMDIRQRRRPGGITDVTSPPLTVAGFVVERFKRVFS